MRTRFRGRLINIGLSLLVLLSILFSLFKVFSFKYADGIYDLEMLYKQPDNSIDVLFLGSSHVFENVNTGLLWTEYGYAAYDLCGSIQPIWNSYYYLNEALKTQNPSVVVLDVFSMTLSDEYSDYSRIVKNTQGMKLSEDKIEAIKASSRKKEVISHVLEYPTFHSRYDGDISREDFFGRPKDVYLGNDWKGYLPNFGHQSFEKPVIRTSSKDVPIPEKNFKYLKKIVELTADKEIPLVLIVGPYVINADGNDYESQISIYNKVKSYAEENNVLFIDYNNYYDDIGLDFSKDYADYEHLSYDGANKYTRFLANSLLSKYNLADHRGDSAYGTYDRMLIELAHMVQNNAIKENTDYEYYFSFLGNEDYCIMISLQGDYKNASNYHEIENVLLSNGCLINNKDDSYVCVMNGSNCLFSDNVTGEEVYSKAIDRYTSVCVEKKMMSNEEPNDSDSEKKQLYYYINTDAFVLNDKGMSIVIYDKAEKKVIAAKSYIQSNGIISKNGI